MRTNYNQKIEQYFECLRAFFQEHNINMSIEHYTGHVLRGARLVNNNNHKSACILCDNNKNKARALNRFYNILFAADITDPDIILKVFANFDD